MRVRTKKQNSGRILRLESSGEIKEILINEDILKPKDAIISICFRGENSSGVVELTKNEIEILNKEIPKKLFDKIKMIKFKK